MYDNWREYGMNDEDIEKKLGKPSAIYFDLVEGYRKVGDIPVSKNANKMIALMPFIATILFFIIGFGFDGWTWGWMAFLLIPMVAIFMNMPGDIHKWVALSPFITLITFFILGFVYNYWHPGWMVFLLIPLTAILVESKQNGLLNTLIAISPIVITGVYVYLGIENNLWIPAWVMFLLIPAIAVIHEKRFLRALFWEVFIFGGIAGYLYVGYTFDEWTLALLSFIPLVVYAILQDIENWRGIPLVYRLLSAGSLIAFVLLGLLTSMWGYFWIVFLIIPVYAIYHEVEGDEKIIALMPFIATFIFFTLGWFFDLWAWAWIAYLLIPMVAIIKEA
jgi:hypothetical protein